MSDSDVHAILDSGLLDLDFYAEVSGQANLSPRELVVHYIQIGWLRDFNPSPWFFGTRYLEENPDVLEAGVNPLLHYISSGRKEGRAASADIGLLERSVVETNSFEAALDEWYPMVPSSGATILILVVGPIDRRTDEILSDLVVRAQGRLDARSISDDQWGNGKTALVHAVLSHSQVANSYEFVFLYVAGDPLSDGLIDRLAAQSRKFSSPIVGVPIRHSATHKVILGFRQTSTGSCRPTIEGQNGLKYGRSIPTQYVVARSVMLNIRVIKQLQTLEQLTWREVCRAFWFRQTPPRVLVSPDDAVTLEAGIDGFESQHFVDGDSFDVTDEWFRSSNHSSGPGFQCLRLVGEIGREVPGHPLVAATIARLEEAGFILIETSEAVREKVALETVGDIKFSTAHDETLFSVGRRQIEMVLNGSCGCGEEICQQVRFTRTSIRSTSSVAASDFWNLRRRLVVSCGELSESHTNDDSGLIRVMYEIGLRPSATGCDFHG